MPTSGRVQPSSLNDVEDYISTKHHLDTPLVFENKTDSFNKYICCGPTGWLGSMIIGAFFALPFVPIKLCCPAKLSQHFLLMVNHDAVIFHSAENDCCCHVAINKQTIPLEKIQDVELQEGCWETCFSLKNVQVQTAGFCDVQTGSLAHPEVAREAILLAAKQYRDRLTLAPAGTSGMTRNGGPTTAFCAGGGGMAGRLARLNQLAQNGVFSPEMVTRIKAGVLTSPTDLTLLFMEAEDLKVQGLVNDKELSQMREALIAQLVKDA